MILRSCPAPQTRSGTTIAQSPKPPEAISAAKHAAGDSLHPHLPSDHREDRPGLADPSLPFGAREERPIAGVDRRSPASVRPEEEGGGGDWSNLTSGPKGPTVSDHGLVHAGVSGGVNSKYVSYVYLFETFFFFFCPSPQDSRPPEGPP